MDLWNIFNPAGAIAGKVSDALGGSSSPLGALAQPERLFMGDTPHSTLASAILGRSQPAAPPPQQFASPTPPGPFSFSSAPPSVGSAPSAPGPVPGPFPMGLGAPPPINQAPGIGAPGNNLMMG